MWSKVTVVLAVAFLLVGRVPTPAQDGLIEVDLATRGKPISPLLWGVFFEEINHAGDGGIYAELVRNRSFEDEPHGTIHAWKLSDSSGASRIAIDQSRPLHARNPRSLRWEIGEGAPPVSLVNEGFWGIAVERGKQYRLSVYARCDERFRGELQFSLQGADGRVYAQHTVRGIGAEWKRFSGVMTSRATDPKARLVVTASAPGTVWLDMVSLMPVDTFKGRPNGLRKDLAQMLVELKPSFLRFPGGCFVEGDRLRNALRWRDTLGDIAERPPRWNLWGYTTTQGLGLHEYLQMSEDLGAEPLLVVNCGMACQFRQGDVAPMEQLDEWIEDALAAIEYAVGPPDSKWGALRARNGHPKPFPLRFVEVGNENWGPAYEERYARFYDAIKARFPQIQIVANSPVRSRPIDVLDEHFYSSAEWFITQANRYDHYDRNGPRIFVGEYAVTVGAGTGNLRAALGEAAFMTGLERNGDLVIMASYAPLFVNTHARQWNPDLIVFDSARVYGTPSYYVQQLFSRYRGTHVLPLKLEAPAISVTEPRGAIGLGTWSTQAEYRDVRVTRNGQTLFSADFTQGAAGWRVVRGDWQVVEGSYRQTSGQTDCRAVAGDPSWTDYTLTLRARKLGGAEGFLILFRVRDDNNWYWWNLGGWGNVKHAVEKCVGGGKSIVSNEVPGRIETGRWYDIRIEVQGNRIRCYLDGQLIHDFEDKPLSALYAVASRNERTREVILKVVNVSDRAVETEVRLQGGRRVQPAGRAITLTGNSLDEENSFEQPKRIAPVERTLREVAPRFRYTFPKHSLTVLVLKEGR
ncbi:MAG: alpha-L-arabinofuranosidase C-terminal domain-containing protein [Armatimonadota bacterium]|nr:alpha-L-arabinofuranosidase C-terminal domain-containing protein [Armatimonadota bacterium]